VADTDGILGRVAALIASGHHHRQALPGNPTRSYRTTEPLRVIEEITGWEPPPPELIQNMRERMAELAELGIEAMDD